MTRKQHRKSKSKNLETKRLFETIALERPLWADDGEKIEITDKDWKADFLAEVKEAIILRDSN